MWMTSPLMCDLSVQGLQALRTVHAPFSSYRFSAVWSSLASYRFPEPVRKAASTFCAPLSSLFISVVRNRNVSWISSWFDLAVSRNLLKSSLIGKENIYIREFNFITTRCSRQLIFCCFYWALLVVAYPRYRNSLPSEIRIHLYFRNRNSFATPILCSRNGELTLAVEYINAHIICITQLGSKRPLQTKAP